MIAEIWKNIKAERIGDGKNIMAIGKGVINVQAKIEKKWVDSDWSDVLHIPNLIIK